MTARTADLAPKNCPRCGREAHFMYMNIDEALKQSPLCWGETEEDCARYIASTSAWKRAVEANAKDDEVMAGCRSRTCAINRAGGMRVSEPCSCDPALVATLREREAIIARLRHKACAHERLARLRKSPALRQWWDWDRATYHEGAADALTEVADELEGA